MQAIELTTPNENRPVALAVLGSDVPSRWNSRTWKVLVCPICGKWHTHGAGKGDEDPREYLGSRSRHCDPRQTEPDSHIGYVLREATLEQSRILKVIAAERYPFHVLNPEGELVSWHRKRSTAVRKLEHHPDYYVRNANLEALKLLTEESQCV